MEYYELPKNHTKKQYLLPGTPCTSIWWSCDARPEKKHVDGNAYSASFLFCPNNYTVGAIVVQHNKMKSVRCRSLLKLGQVLVGRWARGHHYNKYVDPDESGNSFVMYGNSKILVKKTCFHVENRNTAIINSVQNNYR